MRDPDIVGESAWRPFTALRVLTYSSVSCANAVWGELEPMRRENNRLLYSRLLEDAMTFTHAVSIIFFGGLILFNHGCAYAGTTTRINHAMVQGGKAYITVSPSLAFAVPVNVAIGDNVAEAAANAAVGYLKGLPGAITPLNRAEAVQKGVDAGVKTAAETGQPVDREKLKTFVQEVVAKI